MYGIVTYKANNGNTMAINVDAIRFITRYVYKEGEKQPESKYCQILYCNGADAQDHSEETYNAVINRINEVNLGLSGPQKPESDRFDNL